MRGKSLSALPKIRAFDYTVITRKKYFSISAQNLWLFSTFKCCGYQRGKYLLLRLAFQFLRCIKKCSGKFAQTAARNRISSRSKNIFTLALKTFGKNPSGGGVGNEGERLRVWDYPNEQNAGVFYGKGTPFLCLLRNFS